MKLTNISLTRTGSGRFTVYVNGEAQSPERQFESTAIQHAVNHILENPEDEVTLRQDLEIRVEPRFSVVSGSVDPGPMPEPSPEGFVYAQDGQFMLDGQRFSFGSTNAYYLATYESQNPAMVDRALDLFAQTGCSVIRTWGFYDGAPRYSGDPTFQPEPRVYNEEGLQCLDRAIAKGKERGLKFIIPFVNNWHQLGGLPKYMEWVSVSNRRDLLANAEFNSIFEDYISMLLNRVNTVTGTAYKDEPAIHSWQIANELRSSGDPEFLRDWYRGKAQFIKSIDPVHLVATGEEGYDDRALGHWDGPTGNFIHPDYSSERYSNTYVLRADQGSSYVLNTQIPEIDYGNFHWYPPVMGWGTWNDNALEAQNAWLEDHLNIADGKPVVLGEYGLDNAPTSEPGRYEALERMYVPLWQKSQEIGVNTQLWQLTADGTKSREFNGNISVGPSSRNDDEIYELFKAHCQNMK